jgi:hypothetical protein
MQVGYVTHERNGERQIETGNILLGLEPLETLAPEWTIVIL